MSRPLASLAVADASRAWLLQPEEVRSLRARLPDEASTGLYVDLKVVSRNYHDLCRSFGDVDVWYAVKANPAHPILSALAALGAGFDAASIAEIRACLAAGAPPDRISFGNTVKRSNDIEAAFALGVRSFTFDSPEELEKIAHGAPGAGVVCRLAVRNDGAVWRLAHKFGCPADQAVHLMRRAAMLGLRPVGVTFHVGSQQTLIEPWLDGLRSAADVARRLAAHGIAIDLINLGGGIPVPYREPVPHFEVIGDAIAGEIAALFPGPRPRFVLEPGRAIVATAGVLRAQVVLATDRGGHRWVYLDVGRFGGLAETANSATRYPILSTGADDDHVPVVLAGPTCDGDDVLYPVEAGYTLPRRLRAGDPVDVIASGAYTASYASVGFNGFAPLEVRYLAEAV